MKIYNKIKELYVKYNMHFLFFIILIFTISQALLALNYNETAYKLYFSFVVLFDAYIINSSIINSKAVESRDFKTLIKIIFVIFLIVLQQIDSTFLLNLLMYAVAIILLIFTLTLKFIGDSVILKQVLSFIITIALFI